MLARRPAVEPPPPVSRPLVSVVLPVRNGGALLAAAVASILGQTLRALELLVVDDGSTDGAVAALPADPRLRVLANPGRGLVSALNHGMQAARGAFLARMDADDESLPTRLERQLALLDAEPAVGICAAQVEIVTADGPPAAGNRAYQDWLNALTRPADIRRELFVESPLPHPSVVLRRAAWERLGAYRDGPWPEDYELWLRAAAAGIGMAKPDGILLRWRDHPGRLTRTDPRCTRRRLLELKADALARDVLRGRPVLLWGATDTGAVLHDRLLAHGVAVRAFVDLDPRKIGGRKRGRPVLPVAAARAHADAFILATVSQRSVKPAIRADLAALGRVEGEDWLFAT